MRDKNKNDIITDNVDLIPVIFLFLSKVSLTQAFYTAVKIKPFCILFELSVEENII